MSLLKQIGKVWLIGVSLSVAIGIMPTLPFVRYTTIIILLAMLLFVMFNTKSGN